MVFAGIVEDFANRDRRPIVERDLEVAEQTPVFDRGAAGSRVSGDARLALRSVRLVARRRESSDALFEPTFFRGFRVGGLRVSRGFFEFVEAATLFACESGKRRRGVKIGRVLIEDFRLGKALRHAFTAFRATGEVQARGLEHRAVD